MRRDDAVMARAWGGVGAGEERTSASMIECGLLASTDEMESGWVDGTASGRCSWDIFPFDW